MTFHAINLGSAPNDGTGDDLRTAGGKINANFGALFDSIAPATAGSDGLMSAEDKTKLDGIAVQATKNAADAELLARGNHTGMQAIGTIEGLQAALDGKAGTALASPTAPGLMAAEDKVRLDRALTELTGEELTVKAVPDAADQVVIFDSQADQTPRLVPVGAFALASAMGDIRKIVESI